LASFIISIISVESQIYPSTLRSSR